ncbi:hypothetical protein FF011L_49320 [Roseimaritima multifibrata]|uniref:Uncharacterized protein n=1 Tax=Roseimaritima multifibrata TaxID=1930274 RepID=A0A517MML1_9BACT|nr:hypothetical protein FF011L_49320 [Roseimaritima multifibrata]
MAQTRSINSTLKKSGKSMHKKSHFTAPGILASAEVSAKPTEQDGRAEIEQDFESVAAGPLLQMRVHCEPLKIDKAKQWIESGGDQEREECNHGISWCLCDRHSLGSGPNADWRLGLAGNDARSDCPRTHLFFNDKATKPTGIDLHISRKPIFAGGNARTGGDIGMLTYCHSNTLPSFQLLVNHDDDKREFANSHIPKKRTLRSSRRSRRDAASST